jgi:hypothetical protein
VVDSVVKEQKRATRLRGRPRGKASSCERVRSGVDQPPYEGGQMTFGSPGEVHAVEQSRPLCPMSQERVRSPSGFESAAAGG